ncbi:hypothetical protein VCV52_0699 [Vibrio cholerae V52]|nr:hypothetical protein VCV52_0699 [Vibrio cholerae V52]
MVGNNKAKTLRQSVKKQSHQKPKALLWAFSILHFTESVPHLNEMTCYVVAAKQQE